MIRTLTAFLLLAAVATARQAAPKAYAPMTPVQILVDGVSCGLVQAWEGGGVRADVIVEPPGADKVSKKHVGQPQYTPLVVTLPAPLSPPIVGWMSDVVSGKAPRKTVVLNFMDRDMKPIEALQASNCALTRIEFPATDSDSQDAAHLILTFSPETTQTVAPVGATSGAAPLKGGNTAAKKWVQHNYLLQIDGLDATKIARIEGLTIAVKPAEKPVGEQRDNQKEAGALEIPNLAITLPDSASAGWKAWIEDFVVKGNNGDANEKNGSLEFLASNQETILTLQFRNLGIVSLSKVKRESASEQIPRVKVELYCERIVIAPQGVAPATGTLVAPPAALAPPAAPAAPAANPADQGARDPADFPRPDDAVRKSFFSSLTKSGSSETVAYSSKSAIGTLEPFYEAALKKGGWERLNRMETGDPGKATYVLITLWKKATRSAQLSLIPGKAGGGTEIVATLSETLAAPRRAPAEPPKKD